MSKCPKDMLNGPCGSYRNDLCEVNGECVWVKVYKNLRSYEERFNVFTRINLSNFFKVRDYVPPPVRPSSNFAKSLYKGNAIVYEVFSRPLTQDVSSLIIWLSKLSGYVNAYSFVDSPVGLITYDQLALALTVKECVGGNIDVVLNVSGRGRSLDTIVEFVLTALSLGIRNFISITGDWPRYAVNPIYVLDSTQLTYLIRLLADLGVDHLGRKVGIAGRASHIGVVFNQYSRYSELEVLRTIRKLRSGADFLVTQPVYDVTKFKKVILDVKKYYPDLRVLITYALVDSIKRLEKISELGIILSDSEKNRIVELLKKYDAVVANEVILKAVLESCRDLINGLYISTYGDNALALKFLSTTSIRSLL